MLNKIMHFLASNKIETLTPQQLYKQVIDSVVYIEIMDQLGKVYYGAGVVINKTGLILTAAHVVKDAVNLKFSTYLGATYTAAIGPYIDEGRDLATIKPTMDYTNFKPAFFRDLKLNPLNIGADLFAIGHPRQLKWSYTQGIVSQLRTDFIKPDPHGFILKHVIQTDAALNPGNSGGPVFDKKGRCCGIANLIVSKSGDDSGLGLCTSTIDIVEFLAGN